MKHDTGACLCLITDPRLIIVTLTIVELAVRLLAVDDVEAVGGAHTHVAYFEVEPLVVVIAVDV